MITILGEKGLSGIVKRLLDLVFWGGVAIYATLPWVLKWYFHTIYRINGENYHFLLGFLYFTGIWCLLIVYEIGRIFRTLNRKNPFMKDNVRSLKHIAIAAFVIAAAYIVKVIFYNSFLTIILAMVFIIGGLFSIILAEVFHQAVRVKEENDLTI